MMAPSLKPCGKFQRSISRCQSDLHAQRRSGRSKRVRKLNTYLFGKYIEFPISSIWDLCEENLEFPAHDDLGNVALGCPSCRLCNRDLPIDATARPRAARFEVHSRWRWMMIFDRQPRYLTAAFAVAVVLSFAALSSQPAEATPLHRDASPFCLLPGSSNGPGGRTADLRLL